MKDNKKDKYALRHHRKKTNENRILSFLQTERERDEEKERLPNSKRRFTAYTF